MEITKEQYEIYETAIACLDEIVTLVNSVDLREKRVKKNGNIDYYPFKCSQQDVYRVFSTVKELVNDPDGKEKAKKNAELFNDFMNYVERSFL